MSAKEWASKLAKEYPNLNPDNRSEVITLTGELRDAVAEGLDPQGEEANTYAETIAILLSEEDAEGTP